jgi:hypothetical protein
MNEGRMLFAQVMDGLPLHEFHKCVARYRGQYKVQSFSCLDQFLCMAFAQLSSRESLRDIEACLRFGGTKLYHMGIRGAVSRSTLAYANDTRDWRIYADFAQVLIRIAQDLYANDSFCLDLKETIYALDSTTIDLCLSLFPWAHYRKRDGAVKLHTLLDVRTSIPTVIIITHGKVHDVKILDMLAFEPGAIYLMDRGYLDCARLYRIHVERAFFVTRAKTSTHFRRLYSHPIDKSTGLRSDQTVVFCNRQARLDYPDKLRRIRYIDPLTHKRFIFLTNNFTLPALIIARLYQCRWQVELFFKWIKQHLRIKAFVGTSENAVKTQIWIAISTYVLVAILKKRLNLPHSLYTILQILSVSLFEKTPILQAFSLDTYKEEEDLRDRQLDLFE